MSTERDPNARGSYARCVVCDRDKCPRGRDPGLRAGVYCTHECPGYYYQPLAGDLWPSETRAEFGYPCMTTDELAGVGPIWSEKKP